MEDKDIRKSTLYIVCLFFAVLEVLGLIGMFLYFVNSMCRPQE